MSTRTRGYVFLAPFGAGRFSAEHAACRSPPRRETIAQSTGIDMCVAIMVLNWCDCCYTFDRCDTMSLQTLVRVRIRRVNTGPFSSVRKTSCTRSDNTLHSPCTRLSKTSFVQLGTQCEWER